MPTQSELYGLLEARAAALRSAFFPEIRDDLTYSDDERDALAAFILLFHAEVENFIEMRIAEELNDRHKKWLDSRTPNQMLMGLLAFTTTEPLPALKVLQVDDNKQRSDPWKYRDLDERLKRAITSYNYLLNMINHGVRTEQMLSMLLPLGMGFTQLPTDLIEQLDLLGKTRGEIAHVSRRKVKVLPDPATIDVIARNILRELESFDQELQAL